MVTHGPNLETIHFVNWVLHNDDPETEALRRELRKANATGHPVLLLQMYASQMRLELLGHDADDVPELREIRETDYLTRNPKASLWAPLVDSVIQRIDFGWATTAILSADAPADVLPFRQPA